jgi:hypothetical protein
MARYYDPEGNPIEYDEWIRLFNDYETKIVAQDTFLNDKDEEVRVSTVYLGLDHSYGDDMPILIFETMVFGGKHDEYQMRYSTKEKALKGHKEILDMAKGIRAKSVNTLDLGYEGD